ncbi:hypothetical protein [Ferrimonas lipolytica]|uniref:Lipoprotein n=1 Tax=Ferrimonas lipolytica TaxID=2724191 RepID=A0A6H1UEL6_9GAMM|nr:hypothetical protein [Ferrimonas lipolytica]QIZ77547.1 hypothetical protein HER31_11990 [Ferrimonas lipolytica]
MASRFSILLLLVFLSGCECDSICEANKRAKDFFSEEKSNSEIILFLTDYYGEGPGSETYSIFVKWGLKNQQAFISVVNDPQLTKPVLHLIAYSISDIGLSDKYCEFYSSLPKGVEFKLKDLLLGCNSNTL